MTSKFYVGQERRPSISMPRKGSSNISAQDLLNLLDGDTKSGFLREKRITKIMKSVKWRHRFVILAHNALYFYENEMSKTPTTSLPLLGYVAIERETTSTCAWVFALVPGVESLARKSFACSNDVERKEWMHRIKEHLYTANNVKNNSISSDFLEKLKLAENLTPEEQMYVELELPIISPEDHNDGSVKVKAQDHKVSLVEDEKDNGVDDFDSSDDEQNDDDDIIPATSLPKDAGAELRGSSRGSNSASRSPNYEGTTLVGCQIQINRQVPDGVMPPRYSAIVRDKELEYQNLGAAAAKAKELGLERACTITDENTSRDRDKCIELLQKTNKIGTYLIRKSRTQEYKVLAVLASLDSDNSVREYKIDEAYGLYHFSHDKSHEFPTMESLLAFYSYHKPVPKLGTFLGWGIHEHTEGDGKTTYEEAAEMF